MVPLKLILIITALTAMCEIPVGSVQSVELFAGCHSVTNAMKSHGRSAISLDMSTVRTECFYLLDLRCCCCHKIP